MSTHSESHSSHSSQEVVADYHGHPNYKHVYLLLVALFVASLFAGYIGNHFFEIVLVFFLGIVKAWYVITRFMHLKWEPRVFWWAIIFALFCMVVFYYGVYPDLLLVKPHIAQ